MHKNVVCVCLDIIVNQSYVMIVINYYKIIMMKIFLFSHFRRTPHKAC